MRGTRRVAAAAGTFARRAEAAAVPRAAFSASVANPAARAGGFAAAFSARAASSAAASAAPSASATAVARLAIQRGLAGRATKPSWNSEPFVPLRELDMPPKSREEETGVIDSNSIVHEAVDPQGRVIFIKNALHLKSREIFGLPQATKEENKFMVLKEASATIIARMILGDRSVPEVKVFDGGDGVFYLGSYELKHLATLKGLREDAGLSALDPDTCVLTTKDGLTYVKAFYEGEEHLVRVKGRINIKAVSMLLGNCDIANYSNNVFLQSAKWNPTLQRWEGELAMIDWGNAFCQKGFLAEHGFDKIEDAAIYLALNPLDDLVEELHLDDKELRKRWSAKKTALEKILDVPIEQIEQVFKWLKENTPDEYKAEAIECRERIIENRSVVERAVQIMQKLFDVSEKLFENGNDLKTLTEIIKTGTEQAGEAVAFTDRVLEVLAENLDGTPVRGEIGHRYMEQLDALAKKLGAEEPAPYIPKYLRVEQEPAQARSR